MIFFFILVKVKGVERNGILLTLDITGKKSCSTLFSKVAVRLLWDTSIFRYVLEKIILKIWLIKKKFVFWNFFIIILRIYIWVKMIFRISRILYWFWKSLKNENKFKGSKNWFCNNPNWVRFWRNRFNSLMIGIKLSDIRSLLIRISIMRNWNSMIKLKRWKS